MYAAAKSTTSAACSAFAINAPESAKNVASAVTALRMSLLPIASSAGSSARANFAVKRMRMACTTSLISRFIVRVL